jgi:hypothetical protein
MISWAESGKCCWCSFCCCSGRGREIEIVNPLVRIRGQID